MNGNGNHQDKGRTKPPPVQALWTLTVTWSSNQRILIILFSQTVSILMDLPQEMSRQSNSNQILTNSPNSKGIQMASLDQSVYQISKSPKEDSAIQFMTGFHPDRRTGLAKKCYYHIILILTAEQEDAIVDLFNKRQWAYVKAGEEQTGDDLREMCNKMSENNHETDAFDLTNSQQDTPDTRLNSAANNQLEADVLPNRKNDETDSHRFIAVKQEIGSDVVENSMNDAKIGDAANSHFEADILPSGGKEETDEYKYITVKQEIASDNDESNMNDAIMGEFETSTVDHNEPQASSSVGFNHESATVNTTYIRDKLNKPTYFPRLAVFRDAHNIAGQSQKSSQTAHSPQPVASVAGGTLITMGVFCDWCETIFTNQINYQSHLSNDECQWVCKFCKKVFLYSTYNNSAHKEKVLKHKKECDHTCKLCGQSFEERNKLWRHWKLRHSNDREFVCDVCSISFKTQTKLISHKVDKHSGESGIYRCPMCPNEYTVLGGLRDHLKYKHQGMQREEKPCSVCGKMCNSSTIKKHEETHKVKNIKCDQCPAVFNSEKQLKLHKRRHEKEYSHYCDICAKGFYSMASVETHRRIHTGERPFSCSLCAYSCNVKGNLDKHMKTHNKDSRQ